jgi:thiopurine S-methyltransferase
VTSRSTALRPCELWCGDFFALTAKDVGNCSALYDRAALIALPQSMRWRYTRVHFKRILPKDSRGLVITLDYDQSQIDGPPFAVPDDEVQHCSNALRILEDQDVLSQSGKFLRPGSRGLRTGVSGFH